MTSETGVVATPSSARSAVRYDWKKNEVQGIYQTSLPELVYWAQSAHREFHPPDRLQLQTCQLISIKTGGCPEDERLLQTLGMKPLESHAV